MPTKSKFGLVREPAYALKDLDKAAETALFYGFQPVKTPKIEKSDIDQAERLVSTTEYKRQAFPRPEEKISLLRNVIEWNLQPTITPLMLHYRRPTSHLSIKKNDERQYSLDIIGSYESISEAIAIRAAMSILADHGFDNLTVDINSIGDKSSVALFERELTNFSRKHGPNMPPEVKQQLKKDPFEVWRCTHEKWMEVRGKAPQSLSYLSEQSVDHFGQVLEYMETLDIPYRINHHLIGHRHFCSHTIFEIKKSAVPGADSEPKPANQEASQEEDEVYAVGTRHNYLARRIGFKRETPMMSVNIHIRKPAAQKLFFKGKPQPKFFFIQFGSIAKLKSLGVIETLRQARIPVHHELTGDKFIAQLATAESLKVPYIIIMGQKEALENTAVVRHVPSRSQEIILLPDLARYLGRLNTSA